MDILNWTSNQTARDIMGILESLLDPETMDMSNSLQIKQAFTHNRLRPAMFEILCELKQRSGLNANAADDDAPDPQILRLDNMLMAEGIAGPQSMNDITRNSHALQAAAAINSNAQDENLAEHSEYRKKLAIIRANYMEQLDKFEKDSGEFIGHIVTLLQDQALARPISQQEIERIVSNIKKKMTNVTQKIKQDTCEAVMLLRSRFMDARRKRRNFSKTATKVLNDYFAANITNPYPSEEMKEELARKCGISLAQVSNWFGNKRIRFKKNLGKDARGVKREVSDE